MLKAEANCYSQQTDGDFTNHLKSFFTHVSTRCNRDMISAIKIPLSLRWASERWITYPGLTAGHISVARQRCVALNRSTSIDRGTAAQLGRWLTRQLWLLPLAFKSLSDIFSLVKKTALDRATHASLKSNLWFDDGSCFFFMRMNTVFVHSTRTTDSWWMLNLSSFCYWQ